MLLMALTLIGRLAVYTANLLRKDTTDKQREPANTGKLLDFEPSLKYCNYGHFEDCSIIAIAIHAILGPAIILNKL